jgi:hypothetical protein
VEIDLVSPVGQERVRRDDESCFGGEESRVRNGAASGGWRSQTHPLRELRIGSNLRQGQRLGTDRFQDDRHHRDGLPQPRLITKHSPTHTSLIRQSSLSGGVRRREELQLFQREGVHQALWRRCPIDFVNSMKERLSELFFEIQTREMTKWAGERGLLPHHPEHWEGESQAEEQRRTADQNSLGGGITSDPVLESLVWRYLSDNDCSRSVRKERQSREKRG